MKLLQKAKKSLGQNFLIDNNIVNSLVCKIQSTSYEDLMDIKSKIFNLSQFKSINLPLLSIPTPSIKPPQYHSLSPNLDLQPSQPMTFQADNLKHSQMKS